MTTFKELGLNAELMKGLDDLGFVEPSPIQERSIPFILKSKKDLIALAQTGTGKTAAFGLPILNQLQANKKDLQAIIICPTRELCLQISDDIKKFAKYSKNIFVTPVYGGERIDSQIRLLKRGTHIVVGTPGRVHDLIRRKVLKLNTIKWLVFDEADEMLDMGFKEDLDAILEQTPKTRQTLLFSATMSNSVRSIAKQYMGEAEEISIGEKNVGADNVTHEYYVAQARDRFDALKRILDSLPGIYGILFCRTRNETQIVADKLKKAHYDAEAIHGEISQNIRTKIMDRFKRKQIRLLVATDVAARGIDVNDLSHVINYNLPDQNETYTHRSGRTGRAQKSGISISIASPRDVRRIKQLEEMVGKKIEFKKIPSGDDVYQKQIDSFFEEVEKTNIDEISNEKYFQEFVDKLKKLKKDDLINYIITNKFSHLMKSCKDLRDLNSKTKDFSVKKRDDGNNINLKINIGKNHGFDIKGLFALINSNKKLKGAEIGRINLMSEYSVFSVEKGRANDVVKFLDGTKFKGKKINISEGGKSESYQRKDGFNRKYSGKKRGFRKARR
ncbi:DEAD/DEAH box helicase [Candidatus Parcubacteria bacterium]|nr:DEAD/DEAH box helicase [Candidatus Parcubacteria bacterium]